MRTFIPYVNKIEVSPMNQESIILGEDKSLIEAGEVVAVGEKVTFVKVGDMIAFDSWGCSKTPEIDGVQHYVVPEDENVILGKYGSDE